MLPLAFALLFVGVLPPRFDAVIRVEQVKGEGTLQTRACLNNLLDNYYHQTLDLNSGVGELHLTDLHYNLSQIPLRIKDVESFVMTDYELSFRGISLGRYAPSSLIAEDARSNCELVPGENGRDLAVTCTRPGSFTNLKVNSHIAPPLFWFVYALLLLALSAVLALLAHALTQRWPVLFWPIVTGGMVMLALLASAFFCDTLSYLHLGCFLMSWLILLAGACLVSAVTLPFIGAAVTMLVTLLWCIANYYIIRFRIKPIMPSDFKAFGTAMNVAGGYDYTPDAPLVFGALFTVLAAAAVVVMGIARFRKQDRRSVKRSALGRLAVAVAGVLLAVAVTQNPVFHSLRSVSWESDALYDYRHQGMILPFWRRLLDFGLKAPEGYSAANLRSWLEEYQSEGAAVSEGTRPVNILMVMNESFSDLRSVGMEEEIDVMPFLDSVSDDAMTGPLYVPVFGGGTCNSEFEALTGSTLSFSSTELFPYMENMCMSTFSLPEYLASAGYSTASFHAHKSSAWNRCNAYPQLGFEHFYDENEYPPRKEQHNYRWCTRDMVDYDLMDQIIQDSPDDRHFLFDVTIQNHGGYETWDRIRKAKTLEKHQDLPEDAQIYLSLVKLSDTQAKRLVERYRESDEPTMIVFFGDHQPRLCDEATELIYDSNLPQIERFRTRYFIWTNYDTEEVSDQAVSTNFLPYLILERANFPLPPFVQMLREVYEKYPVLCVGGAIDADGNFYESINELRDDPLIQKYEQVQYASLTGKLNEAWYQVP